MSTTQLPNIDSYATLDIEWNKTIALMDKKEKDSYFKRYFSRRLSIISLAMLLLCLMPIFLSRFATFKFDYKLDFFSYISGMNTSFSVPIYLFTVAFFFSDFSWAGREN